MFWWKSIDMPVQKRKLIVCISRQEYEEQLSSGAVAYINLDAAVRGKSSLWCLQKYGLYSLVFYKYSIMFISFSSSFFLLFFCLNTWTYEHLEMSSKCFKWQLYSAPLCFRAETLHSSHNYAIEWVTEGSRSTFGISTRVGTVLFGYCMPDALWSCCCFGAHSVYSYNHAPVYRITLSEAAYIRCMFV